MAETRALSLVSGFLELPLLLLFVFSLGSFLVTEERIVSSTPYGKNSIRAIQILFPASCRLHGLRLQHHGGRRTFLRGRLPYDVDGARSFQLIRLCGDTHPDPGPFRHGIKYPCGECQRSVRSNQDAILCYYRYHWFHANCAGMSKQAFKYYLNRHNLDWESAFCALPKLNDSFFDDDLQRLQALSGNVHDSVEHADNNILAEKKYGLTSMRLQRTMAQILRLHISMRTVLTVLNSTRLEHG